MGIPTGTRVFVAGHRGMVGSALVRVLRAAGLTRPLVHTRRQLDLAEGPAVRRFLTKTRPDWVFLAAARVGGIAANDARRGEFIRDNLAIQTAVIHEAWRAGVKRLMFLGSSCIYPREAPQPLREEYLLTGPLERTNRPYAVAKIAGIEMCDAYHLQYGCDFRAVMPTNLYGPGDSFDPEHSHVIPALIRKFHEAKVARAPAVTVWGTGTPRREFLHVDDLAEACLRLMALSRETWDREIAQPFVNVGCGEDLTVAEVARLVAKVTGYDGLIEFDSSRPDGTPRKLLDVSRMRKLGWQPRTGLERGLRLTYRWFLRQVAGREPSNPA